MKNSWIVFRLDAKIKSQPIDIYFVLDVATGKVLSFETVQTELSQTQADMLLRIAKTKSTLEKIIITKGDPAELLVCLSANKLRINFETRSVLELEEFIIPVRRSFCEYLFSPSSLVGSDNASTGTVAI